MLRNGQVRSRVELIAADPLVVATRRVDQVATVDEQGIGGILRQRADRGSGAIDVGAGAGFHHVDRADAGDRRVTAAGHDRGGAEDAVDVARADPDIVLRHDLRAAADMGQRLGLDDVGGSHRHHRGVGRTAAGDRGGDDVRRRVRIDPQVVQRPAGVLGIQQSRFDLAVHAVDRRGTADRRVGRACHTASTGIDARGVRGQDGEIACRTAAVFDAGQGACGDVVAGVGEHHCRVAGTGAAEGQRGNGCPGGGFDARSGAADAQLAVEDARLAGLVHRTDGDRTSTGTVAGTLHVAGQGLDIGIAAHHFDRDAAGPGDRGAPDEGAFLAFDHVDGDRGAGCRVTRTAATDSGGTNVRRATAFQLQRAGQGQTGIQRFGDALGQNDVVGVGYAHRDRTGTADGTGEAPDGAIALGGRQGERADLEAAAVDGRALFALQYVAGRGTVHRNVAGTTAGNGDGVDVLLSAAEQAGAGETADRAVLGQGDAVGADPVDRDRAAHRGRAAAFDRTRQRSDHQPGAAAGIEQQRLAGAAGGQGAVLDRDLVFAVDHVDHDRAANAGLGTAASIDADAPDLSVQG